MKQSVKNVFRKVVPKIRNIKSVTTNANPIVANQSWIVKSMVRVICKSLAHLHRRPGLAPLAAGRGHSVDGLC